MAGYFHPSQGGCSCGHSRGGGRVKIKGRGQPSGGCFQCSGHHQMHQPVTGPLYGAGNWSSGAPVTVYEPPVTPQGQWMRGQHGSVPAGAVMAAQDHGGNPQYVARAHHSGDLLPGKLVPHYGKCFVPWGGREIEKTDYEVLCHVGIRWQSVSLAAIRSGSLVPLGAIQAGHTSSGETLYVGRVRHLGTQQLGKVHPSHNCCYMPYGGKEIPFHQNFEILVAM